MIGLRSPYARYGLSVALVIVICVLTLVLKPWLETFVSVLGFTMLAVVSCGFFRGFRTSLTTLLLSIPPGGFLLFREGEAPPDNLIAMVCFIFVIASGVLYIIWANDAYQEQAKTALEALEVRSHELRTVIEALPIGIWFTDKEGTVISSNKAAREFYGETPIGLSIDQDDTIKVWNKATDRVYQGEEYPAARVIQKGETITNETFEIETPQKGHRSVLISAFPLNTERNREEIRGALLVIEDITEREAALEELKRAKEEAEAANLAKDRFLAVLSHELRTPLTPVLMLAESMEKHPEMPATLRMDASMIRRYVSLEARLIDDLLDLTRIEKGKLHLEKTVVDINELIQSVVEFLRLDALNKEIGISLNLHATRHYINADRARLKQVVWNLLGNALKFTPPGGGVALLTENCGENVQITVKDSGIGVPAQALSSIFEAFEQAVPEHRRFGGLGLGLAIARSLVEFHGGSICAESEGVGKGATFRVLLPATQQPAFADPAPVKLSRSDLDIEHLRILLVEDHEPTAFVLSKLLRRRGHDVRMAASVHEARSLDGQAIDLLVSDIGLPDGSGIDVIRHFKKTHASFRAIALSGFGMENDIDQSLKAGFDRHLIKPVDFKTLEESIDNLFAYPFNEEIKKTA